MTTTIASNVQLGQALFDGFNTRDLSKWESALADDVEISYPGFRGMRGKEAAKAYNAPFIVAFSDLNFQTHRVVEDGNTVIYTWTAKGTHDGPLATPKGPIPPTGGKGSIDGVLIATIKNGKIVREETYWNILDLLAQLGVM